MTLKMAWSSFYLTFVIPEACRGTIYFSVKRTENKVSW